MAALGQDLELQALLFGLTMSGDQFSAKVPHDGGVRQSVKDQPSGLQGVDLLSAQEARDVFGGHRAHGGNGLVRGKPLTFRSGVKASPGT